MQKLVTRRVDLGRSMQTGVPVVQSESSDSPWTSGSAANQKGGARSQRGQPRQIKCWTCFHPRKSSFNLRWSLTQHLRLQLHQPASRGFQQEGRAAPPAGRSGSSLGFKQANKQTNKLRKSVCLTQEPGAMAALAGGLPRMMRPSPHQNYPRGGYSLEGKHTPAHTLYKSSTNFRGELAL